MSENELKPFDVVRKFDDFYATVSCANCMKKDEEISRLTQELEAARGENEGYREALGKLAKDIPAEFVPELNSMGYGVTGSLIAKEALAPEGK